MIYVHSIGRGAKYYPKLTALSVIGKRLTFLELDQRIERIATALHQLGFRAGDRLAVLLPNESEYLELIYACSRLGIIVVPLNTRYSAQELDRVLADSDPHGLERHSSLPEPKVQLAWQRGLDKEPFEITTRSCPEVFYDPGGVLSLSYRTVTTVEATGG